MRSSSKSNREHWRRAITGALPESIDEPILHRERPLMVVMEVIDPGGECSVVELEGRGFYLPDEPGDPLRVAEVFRQFFTELAQHGTVAPGAEHARLGIKRSWGVSTPTLVKPASGRSRPSTLVTGLPARLYAALITFVGGGPGAIAVAIGAGPLPFGAHA
jgi:hypothetical protein